MQDIVGRAWTSACSEYGAVAYTWLSAECDWTSGHMYNTGTTGQADRWKHSSYLFWHTQWVAPIPVARRDLSPVTQHRNSELGNTTSSIDRLPCGYLYHCSHWIGMSMSGLRPCCKGDCSWFMSSTPWVFSNERITHDAKQEIEATYGKWSVQASKGLAQALPRLPLIFGEKFCTITK